MNWSDTMTENALRLSSERTRSDTNDLQDTASIAWDPREVWLTRVKQPRDLAAVRVMAVTLNQASTQQD